MHFEVEFPEGICLVDGLLVARVLIRSHGVSEDRWRLYGTLSTPAAVASSRHLGSHSPLRALAIISFQETDYRLFQWSFLRQPCLFGLRNETKDVIRG